MSNTFKTGDKVKCIDGYIDDHPYKGQEYICKRVYENYVNIQHVSGAGKVTGGWCYTRFVLVEQKVQDTVQSAADNILEALKDGRLEYKIKPKPKPKPESRKATSGLKFKIETHSKVVISVILLNNCKEYMLFGIQEKSNQIDHDIWCFETVAHGSFVTVGDKIGNNTVLGFVD